MKSASSNCLKIPRCLSVENTLLASLIVMAFGLFGFGPNTYAADTPVDKTTIIESLKPKPEMKTRSLRNLSVEKVEPPSISLVIEFDFNSAKISPDSLRQIEVLAEAMASDDLLDYAFKVEGHTDAKGKPEYNQKLSERRAQAVKEALARKGIANDRLVALGKGSLEPANASDPFAAENRRVKVITLND